MVSKEIVGDRWINLDAVLRAFDARIERKVAEMDALVQDDSPDPDHMRFQDILARRDNIASERKTKLSIEVLADAMHEVSAEERA